MSGGTELHPHSQSVSREVEQMSGVRIERAQYKTLTGWAGKARTRLHPFGTIYYLVLLGIRLRKGARISMRFGGTCVLHMLAYKYQKVTHVYHV
jgi:hypothetical protein